LISDVIFEFHTTMSFLRNLQRTVSGR